VTARMKLCVVWYVSGMHIYIFIYIYTCIYMCTYIHINMYINIHTYMYVYTYHACEVGIVRYVECE